MALRTVDEINAEHPQYSGRKRLLRQYRDLYVGGEQFRANASTFLLRRQKEPLDVYSERLSRVFYENYIGSIIDWYIATLFRREPLIIVEGEDRSARSFLAEFSEDCDLRGTSLTDFYRQAMLDALVCGSSYVLVDFPRQKKVATSRAEEEIDGAARAYLTHCSAESLINWSTDERGNFEWVVLRNEGLRNATFRNGQRETVTQWTYFDRENYQVYRKAESDQDACLIDGGRHGLAGLQKVPVMPIFLSEGLWLMNRGALLQLEHFNKSNALGWALSQGLFAQPVIYSEREWSQMIGDSYFIQLGPNDKFGWTEPSGKVYEIAAENLKRLQTEVYRVCYLQHLAGGSPIQSGLSKLRDFAITQEVLRAYGDCAKDSMKRVLRTVAAARQDNVSIDISGLEEFDIGDFGTELEDAQKLLDLGVGSTTLRTQVLKKLAFKFLCDVRQEVKDRIGDEIDRAAEKDRV